MENEITQAKIDLIKKIIDAKLNPQELQEVTLYTASLIENRPHPAYKAG